MDERDLKTESTSLPEEEEVVRRLLETAGPPPEIPQEDLDAISAAARSAWQAEVRRRAGSRRPIRALTLGLAAVLVVAVGLALWRASRQDSRPATIAWVEAVTGSVHLETEGAAPRVIAKGEPIPLGAALRSGGSTEEARASLRLASGTTVRLDMETRLRLISAAVVELERGALFVDTGLDSRSSNIEVRTPLGTVRDIGTQFSLRIEKTALLVRVRDGSVVTEQLGRTHLTPAGQELVLGRDGTVQRRQVALSGSAWEWVLAAAPGFDIEGRTLQEFLDWVSHETGWRIEFADAGLAASADEIVLHGSIGELRPDQAPFAVLPGAGFAGEIEDGRLVVRRRGTS